MGPDHPVGTNIFYPVTVTLEFDLLFEYFNLVNNIWSSEC